MLKSMFFQRFLTVITLSVALSCAQSEAQQPANSVLLKNPRKDQSTASSVALKTPNFKSKNSYLNTLNKALLQTPSGHVIDTYLALSTKEQTQGVSGIKPNDFKDKEAMLFFYTTDSAKSFWMPDTYFNLDIFFLDRNFKVIAVERNVPHHPGRDNPSKIYATQNYVCRHVLELKHSNFSKQIVPGTKLIWISSPDHSQIGSKIHPGK